jgi:predicted RecA/RadA family phage recombinase
MDNYRKSGERLTLTPGANVASGIGHLFGTALFGVALADVVSGSPGEFLITGEVTLDKTSALAIAVGDVLYWDATNKVVNKTTLNQRAIGVATSVAGNPSATVNVLLGVPTEVGTA